MTIDKLGVRLYDTVSAVVAELVANGFDADASEVSISLPFAVQLAKRTTNEPQGAGAQWTDAGFEIEVSDNGHGMTPEEAQEHFLQVGRDRRANSTQGGLSRNLRRPVMGRKGIGKLAPFGICRRIEVRSAGGVLTAEGYQVSHFIMDYDRIVTTESVPAVLETGPDDGKFESMSGTTIRLSNFLGKRVPDDKVFLRQLARRFAPRQDFSIVVWDPRDATTRKVVGPLDVPIQESTKVDLSLVPVISERGDKLPVSGWLALAKDAYKDEETTGVRIYSRGKIVGWTRDFEQPAGYTGEFTIRSYLVGEVHAEWLDLDDGEDLIRTDRQGIIWDSDYGNALRLWGADQIKRLGAVSRAPRRERVSSIFVTASRIEDLARERFADPTIVSAAMNLAKNIGGFAAEDELTDAVYISDLSEMILDIAPHTALVEAFKAFEEAVEKDGEVSLAQLQSLFGKTLVAEMASYGQIAKERVAVIHRLESLVVESKNEDEFQRLIADAPWLIEPTWSVISTNEALSTFKQSFEAWFKKTRGEDVVLAIQHQRKRPDFTLADVNDTLHVIEIKAGDHTFNDTDYVRLSNYIEAFDEFFESHETIRREFPAGYRIDLITNAVSLKQPPNKQAYQHAVEKGKVKQLPWTDFLNRARKSHEQFLAIARRRSSALERINEQA